VLLPAFVRWGLVAVGVLLAAGAIKILRQRRPPPASTIPGATVIGSRAADLHRLLAVPRRLLVRWSPVLAIPAGIALALWAWDHDVEYVVVTDGDGGPEAVRRYGNARRVDVPLAPGADQPTSGDFLDPHWVINRSSRAVRVTTTHYGRTLAFGASEPFVIPPGTAAHFNDIDHIGPADPPPSSVRDEYNLGMQTRYWLTW
jgi:hypothetical protein